MQKEFDIGDGIFYFSDDDEPPEKEGDVWVGPIRSGHQPSLKDEYDYEQEPAYNWMQYKMGAKRDAR